MSTEDRASSIISNEAPFFSCPQHDLLLIFQSPNDLAVLRLAPKSASLTSIVRFLSSFFFLSFFLKKTHASPSFSLFLILESAKSILAAGQWRWIFGEPLVPSADEPSPALLLAHRLLDGAPGETRAPAS